MLTLEIEDFFLNRNTPEYEEHEKFIKKLYKYKDRMQVVYFDTKDILERLIWDCGLSESVMRTAITSCMLMRRWSVLYQWTENTHLRNATITGLTG